MSAAQPPRLVEAAARLDDETIHVWSLDYQPAQKRRPLLRTLAAYLDVGEDEVALVEGPHGRPRLDPAHRSALDFNWSHSGDHAVIAVARGIAPGIDLERLRPQPRALAIARRFFGREEARALAALPEAARAAVFFELWTAKEAVLKAHGHGISYGLQRLHIGCTPTRLQLLRFDDEEIAAWQLQRLAIGPGLIAALAWRGSPRAIEVGPLASTG